MIIYKVSEGETIASISEKFQTIPALIERDNGQDCVYAGARIIVRQDVVMHVVHPFERLDTIAQRYGVSMQSVLAENKLVSPAVYAGQLLIIPSGVRHE